MKASSERSLLVAFVGTVGLVITIWAFVEWFQINSDVAGLAKHGIIIDLSPDQFELDSRVGFGLIFAAIVLVSRRAAQIGLISAVLWYAFVALLFAGSNPFDAPEPLIHIITLILLLIAFFLWWRKTNLALISALAPLYLFINYFLWYLRTQRIKRNAGVPMLGPNLLDNLLYGAQWWHILYLFLSLAVLAWIGRYVWVESRASKASF